MNSDDRTDERALALLGEQLSRYRLDRNLTQAEVATEAGVHKNTVFRLEAGGSTQTKNLVRVLRALGLLDRLDAIVPEPVPSPLKQLKAADRQRKRAVSKASRNPAAPRDIESTAWSWGDDNTSGRTAGDDETGDAS